MSPVKSPEELGAPDDGKQDKIVVEKDEAEELLPGWTKEVKIRKTGSATKVDRFYTDPVTGYIFRSLKDVQRYLKTGVVGRLAIKPKGEKREQTGESKEQMSESLKHKRAPADKPELPARASKRLAGVNIDAPSSPSQPKTRQATRLAGIKVDPPPSSPPPPAPKTRQAAGQAGTKIDSETRQATPLTGTEIGPSPPSKPEPKTRQAKRASETKDNEPKTRRATRQSGIKIDSPPPSPPDSRTSRQSIRTRLVNPSTPKGNNKKTEAGNADMDANTNHNQEHNKPTETGPTTSPPKDQAPPSVTAPPVNPEKQESPVVNPTLTNPTPQDSYNFSMNDLWTDPCIEFAVKTLTGAIPVTDLNKVENFSAPLEVPLQEFWTDPCIEFAVKTLTGAIPVGEDDYLLHRPDVASSSNLQLQGPHQFSSPDVLSRHYETGHKNKQQDSVFPTLGNGGLQKSGKFVNAGNGQCSRSRFFQ